MKSKTIASIIIFLAVMAFIPGMASAQADHSSHQAKVETQQKNDTPSPAPQDLINTPDIPFSTEKRQFTGVVVKAAESIDISKKIRTVGRIELNEKSIVTVNTKFEGWIEKLHVNYTGKAVKKGETLAEIYSPDLYSAQQEYLALKKWAKEQKTDDATSAMMQKDAKALLDAARKRLSLWDISNDQINQIEKTGTPERTVKIFSPSSGFIQSKPAVQGMRMMPGEKLFDIADISTLWIIAEIYENDLVFIKPGLKTNISLSYFPGKKIESVVDYIYPDLSQETRTAKVRLILDNPEQSMKPGMFTNIEITADLGKRLVVPEESIIDTGLRKLVYVEKDQDSFTPREVTTGISANGMTEILSGLKHGDKIAAKGNFLIDSEAQLKGIIPSDKH